MRPDETIEYHIKSSWLSIARMYNQLAAGYSSTQAQVNLLLIIDKEKGTPSTSIGPKLGMHSTGLTRLLRKMESEGLIFRRSDPDDKRKVMICLSELGLQKRKLASHVVIDFNKKIQHEISEQEFATFKNVIAKVNKVVDSYKQT